MWTFALSPMCDWISRRRVNELVCACLRHVCGMYERVDMCVSGWVGEWVGGRVQSK